MNDKTITQDVIERLIKERAVIIENDGAVVFQQIHHLIGFIEAYQATITQQKRIDELEAQLAIAVDALEDIKSNIPFSQDMINEATEALTKIRKIGE